MSSADQEHSLANEGASAAGTQWTRTMRPNVGERSHIVERAVPGASERYIAASEVRTVDRLTGRSSRREPDGERQREASV